MASNYPTSIDSFPDPLSTSPLNSPSHAAQHQDINDAVEKLETKVGVGASPAASATAGQVLTATGTGSSWQQSAGAVVAVATSTATTAVVGGVALAVLSVTFTVIPNRRYMITGRLAYQPLAAASGIKSLFLTASGLTTTTLFYETANVAQFLCATAQGTAYFTAANFGVTSGSGTSKTVTLNFRMANGGTLNTDPDGNVGANSFPQQLIVCDLGAI